VVRLLVESGASTTAETTNGRVPLWFAAGESNLAVVTYLIQQSHETYELLEDRKVIISISLLLKIS
jgi:ankyrin repeat protein